MEIWRTDTRLDDLRDNHGGLIKEEYHKERVLAEGRVVGDGVVGRAYGLYSILLRGAGE